MKKTTLGIVRDKKTKARKKSFAYLMDKNHKSANPNLRIIKISSLGNGSRRMADIIFGRLLNILSSNEFDIIVNANLDPFAGYVDYEKNKIYLNPNQYTVIETLIHELLHIIKPKADEKTIIEMTGLIFEELSDAQKGLLWSYIDALTTRCIGVCRRDLVGAE